MVGLIQSQSISFTKTARIRQYCEIVHCATIKIEQIPLFGLGISPFMEPKTSNNSMPSGGKKQRLNCELDKEITVEICKTSRDSGTLKVFPSNSQANIVNHLKRILGDNVSVDIELEVGKGSDLLELNVEDLKFFDDKPTYGDENNVCSFKFPILLAQEWEKNLSLNGKLTMTLSMKDSYLENILNYEHVQGPMTINRKMRMDTETMDATIISGTGRKIKCHKLFLTTNSDAFKAMFQSGMVEGTTQTVNMPDMSTTGVQALLDFVYCRDTEKASKSCSVAMELLLVGDKYSIENLEKSMLLVMNGKENEWFSVAVALQLLLFAISKFDNEKSLTYRLVLDMATSILRSKTLTQLEQCRDYQDLFVKCPKVAMGLCNYFIFNES